MVSIIPIAKTELKILRQRLYLQESAQTAITQPTSAQTTTTSAQTTTTSAQTDTSVELKYSDSSVVSLPVVILVPLVLAVAVVLCWGLQRKKGV